MRREFSNGQAALFLLVAGATGAYIGFVASNRPIMGSASVLTFLMGVYFLIVTLGDALQGTGTALRYANPANFLRLVAATLPWVSGLAALTLALGLYLSFFVAPADYQQGDAARIMYVHVPAAWLSMFCYATMSVSALGTLVWRHPLADAAQKAAAPIGAAFTLICLVTGSLWGKPMWGTWWVWDARLTSVLVLFLIYLAIIAVWQTIEEPTRAGRAAAILTLVGAVNLPIIKFSVNWWNTLHQEASVMRMGGPAIHPSMLWPLLVMALAFTLIFIALHLAATRNEILRRRLRRLSILAAQGAA